MPRTDERPELRYRGHIPGLDVLRGVAILEVLCYHGIAGNQPPQSWTGLPRLFVRAATYGSTGVHLFFVLSGFLITGILLDDRGRPGAMRDFYVRRALRILPAYLLMLIVLKLSGMIGWNFVLACLLYIANMARLVGARDSEYGSLWSLAVEEQFYLIWPWIVSRCSLRTLQQIMAAVCVGTVLLRFGIALWMPQSDHYYKTWVNADYLLYGAIIANACRQGTLHRGNIGRIRTALLIFGIAGIAGVVTLAQFSMPLAVAAVIDACHLLPFIAVYLGLLLLALERNSGTTSTNVAARVMMFLGGISYGLYLVHSLIYTLYDKATESTRFIAVAPHFGNQLLRAVLGAVISILLAYLSRTYFEERFLRLKERWTSKPKRPTPEPQTVS